MLGETTGTTATEKSTVGNTGPISTTEVPKCLWYQDYTNGACQFSTVNAIHTVFQLPGSVVVGLINPTETVLKEHWITLSTAISLLVWGGAVYYAWKRFSQ